jgi:hypothetical protein
MIFPFFNNTFFEVGMIAFFVWLTFWASTNLVDAYYLTQIWKINKKEYGSSTYWMVFSAILFLMMFISSLIDKQFGFDVLMYTMWLSVLIINIFTYKKALWK